MRDDDMCTRGRRATPLFGKEDARPRTRAAFADRDKDDVDFGTTVTILKGENLSFNAREKKKKKKKNDDER